MRNKRVYSKPILESETFIPQNYIAACGDSGTVYKFTCDAGGGVPGDVYLETNGREGYQKGFLGFFGDKYLSSYHACGITHEASTTDDFLDGYYITGSGRYQKVIPVKVWRGPNNDNTHCTENIDMSTWETAKS